MPPATEASFLGGFVAAEGTFTSSGRPPVFTFAIALSAADSSTCERMMRFLDVGNIQRWPRRRAHYDDEVAFQVRKARDLVEVVVPFMDEHLPPSYKRQQYLTWRERLLDHWEHGARRRRTCTVEGCEASQRGRGLCRRHYYAAYGA